jgi:hypothetical protein
LRGVPRDPDLILTLECALLRVVDLTTNDLYSDLGTSYEELISSVPSRFVLNARKEETPTQQLGSACFRSGRISALKIPSAANPNGYCLDILPESLVVGERVAILDKNGRLKAEVKGWIPIRRGDLSKRNPNSTEVRKFSSSFFMMRLVFPRVDTIEKQ